MEKKNNVVCPFCKCKVNWFIQAMGDEKAFQCTECSRYFKVREKDENNQESKVRIAQG